MTVTAETPFIDTRKVGTGMTLGRDDMGASASARSRREADAVAPPDEVVNLQRRVAGVLPVPIEVPRAGTSHAFARTLVLDEETTLRLRYKRR